VSSNCFSDGLQNERLARGKGLHIGRQEDMFTPDQDRKEP
jgi:hypothetical protein